MVYCDKVRLYHNHRGIALLLSGVKWEQNTIYHRLFFWFALFFIAGIRQIYMNLCSLNCVESIEIPHRNFFVFLVEDSSKFVCSLLLLIVGIGGKEAGREFRYLLYGFITSHGPKIPFHSHD